MTAASSSSTTRSLAQLVDARAPVAEIAAFLDGVSSSERVAQVLRITGSGVKRLYDAVADGPAASLDDLVPPGIHGTVAFEGRNSLPAFTRFQKRFTRLEDDSIIGHNHQSISFLTGPGYFWVRPPSGSGEHGKELVFDYTEETPSPPEGWPVYKSNLSGFSRLVYGNMKDYVRRVARGVVVGKAYRSGVDQGAYFSLSLP